MFFKRKKKTEAPPVQAEELCPEPMDPAMYGKLVDGELPAGWLEYHAGYLMPRDEMLRELELESGAAPDEESAMALHEEYLRLYERCREEFAERGECFAHYFSVQYEGKDRIHREWIAAHREAGPEAAEDALNQQI